MGRVKEAPSGGSPPPPEDLLLLALRAGNAQRRMRYAQQGLACEQDAGIASDTKALLLRQVYLAHLEMRQLQRAADVARRMAEAGPLLRDVGYHDAARALFSLGDPAAAIEAQRLAVRAAPAERRSFQLWSLATLQHFAGDPEGALATLRRALRWSQRDRPLLRAHAAYVRLDAGKPVRKLDEIRAELGASKSREGYGQFLLGMIAHLMGDPRRASVHLRAFLNRNASADPAKALTLREELRRARLTLAHLESA